MESRWLMLRIQTCAILLLFSIMGFNIQGSDGLKDVKVEAKSHVRRGETVTLTCKYDTEGEGLYAVKWYRNNQEFYRFVPKESPPQNVFPLLGINVDEKNSTENYVILKDVSLETNGKFKCAVSVEVTFQTLENTKEMSVVVIGYDNPKLSVDKVTYHPGESGLGNCTMEKTFPAANITWFINDQEVVDKDRPKVIYVVDPTDPALKSTVSLLSFKVPDAYSPIRLKCTGQMYDIYNQSSVINIQSTPPANPPYVSDPSTLRDLNSNASSASSTLGRGSTATQAVHSNLITFFQLLSAQLVIYTSIQCRLQNIDVLYSK